MRPDPRRINKLTSERWGFLEVLVENLWILKLERLQKCLSFLQGLNQLYGDNRLHFAICVDVDQSLEERAKWVVFQVLKRFLCQDPILDTEELSNYITDSRPVDHQSFDAKVILQILLMLGQFLGQKWGRIDWIGWELRDICVRSNRVALWKCIWDGRWINIIFVLCNAVTFHA